MVNPEQARTLLDAVWEHSPVLAAFFSCLYYAGLRPAEALALRESDGHLREEGWGHLLLVRSRQHAGTAWTDSAATSELRGLKHRSRQDSRPVPAHAKLVAILRRHRANYPSGVDGQLFVARTGRAGVPLSPPYAGAVSTNTLYRAWHQARAAALSEEQQRSPLSRRPYDLRHACLSTWLNAGVPQPPARFAQWAATASRSCSASAPTASTVTPGGPPAHLWRAPMTPRDPRTRGRVVGATAAASGI